MGLGRLESAFAGAPASQAGPSATAFQPDVEVALRAVRASAQLLSGPATDVWTFQGRVLRGGAGVLAPMASGSLGPTFHVRRGQKLRVLFDNGIPEPTVVHWHGLRAPEAADGHPRFAIGQGQRYTYEFEVRNAAGTYWYHAHPDMRTGPQIYRGLSGLFVVHDAEDERLDLPREGFDRSFVIQDRSFDSDNQLLYSPNGMHAMEGWLGDRILVNGALDYSERVATRAYRLRLLNGSNSRIYRLAWHDGTPLTVIGSDGGLLPQPVQRDSVLLAPAERLELWVDLAGRSLGSKLGLVSLPFDAGGGMRMGPRRTAPPQGARLDILTLQVAERSSVRLPLPAKLIPLERYREADAVNRAAPRRVVPTMQHMSWGLNGRRFELESVAADERVKLGKLEIWEFDNAGMSMGAGPGRGRGGGMGGMGMMGMAMPHPLHLHGGQFQVLRRAGVTHTGYVDDGWKDTVLVMPGERASILMRYLDYTGLYMYHCHNLEHEDAGMMRNFLIEA